MTARHATAAGPQTWTDAPEFVNEVEACLTLRHCPGLGPRTWKRILSRYPTAVAALADARSLHRQRLCSEAVAAALIRGDSREPARQEAANAAAKGITPLPFSHPAYPARLREIPDPPVLLYVRGDPTLLGRPAVALVGARQCSRYGAETARQIAAELSAAGVTVVSGLALGIDRQAHLGGLSGPGASVAVLGTGLDLVYPNANLDVWRAMAEKGALVSEFAPGTPPQAQNFPIRNRVIAGLSLGVMVVEAAARSGSLITARLALDQGREVFALPGPVNLPTFAGCHSLLASGATLVQSAEDVLTNLARELTETLDVPPPPLPPRAPAARPTANPASERAAPPATPPPAPPKLSGLEADVAAQFTGQARLHIDTLARRLDTTPAAVSRALVCLELKGLVRKWPGMYYSREPEEHGPACRKSL